MRVSGNKKARRAHKARGRTKADHLRTIFPYYVLVHFARKSRRWEIQTRRCDRTYSSAWSSRSSASLLQPEPRPQKIDQLVIDGHVIPNHVLFTAPTPDNVQHPTLVFSENLKVTVSFLKAHNKGDNGRSSTYALDLPPLSKRFLFARCSRCLYFVSYSSGDLRFYLLLHMTPWNIDVRFDSGVIDLESRDIIVVLN